jgi:hypothetical protein
VPLVLRIDSLVGIVDPTPALVVFAVAEAMLDKVFASNPDLVPSRQIANDIRASDPRLGRGQGLRREPAELFGMVHAEVCRLLGAPKVALLLDGLDRAPIAVARAAVQGFVEMRDTVPIVVIVDPELANGPASRDLLTRYRVFSLPAIPVRSDAQGSDRGVQFLSDVLARRLSVDLPAAIDPIVRRAADRSGGVVRTFLDLVADSVSYAVIEGSDVPTEASLAEAVRDRADNLRRLLRDGDLDGLAASAGTDGLEVDVDRRVRFLSAGLLLEYPAGEDTIVEPHPMLARLIENRAPSKPAKKPRKKG